MNNPSDSEKPESDATINADNNDYSDAEKRRLEESEFFEPDTEDFPDEDLKEEQPVILPTIPESVYTGLPELLRRAVAVGVTDAERDVLLLGSIVVLGACMPNIFGYYNGDKVHPNLYLFVTAPASGGKGRLNACLELVMPVQKALLRESKQLRVEYQKKKNEYLGDKQNNKDMEQLRLPPAKMLLIPANNTSAGVLELLHDNEGKGLIFETEGDTLSLAFKTKHGDYSDGYRKAFHHECISCYRKTNQEYINIEHPQMSSVLAGTFDQIHNLIPSAENGLFSRFIFYFMNMNMNWKDVFSDDRDYTIKDYFKSLGDEYFKLYEALNKSEAIQFCFTESQKSAFHEYFLKIQDKYLCFQGIAYIATIRRLGLIAFRIAMTLHVVRMLETGDFSRKQKCGDVDFHASLDMIKVLISHASFVFTNLPKKRKATKKPSKKEQFLEKLPREFNHREYINIAKELGIKERSAEGYMAGFCSGDLIQKVQRDKYINHT